MDQVAKIPFLFFCLKKKFYVFFGVASAAATEFDRWVDAIFAPLFFFVSFPSERKKKKKN